MVVLKDVYSPNILGYAVCDNLEPTWLSLKPQNKITDMLNIVKRHSYNILQWHFWVIIRMAESVRSMPEVNTPMKILLALWSRTDHKLEQMKNVDIIKKQ